MQGAPRARARTFRRVKGVTLQAPRLANASRRECHRRAFHCCACGLLVLRQRARTFSCLQIAPGRRECSVEHLQRLRRQAFWSLEKWTHGSLPCWQAGARRCLSATGAWNPPTGDARHSALTSAACRGINSLRARLMLKMACSCGDCHGLVIQARRPVIALDSLKEGR
jgi:hypothetical protein